MLSEEIYERGVGARYLREEDLDLEKVRGIRAVFVRARGEVCTVYQKKEFQEVPLRYSFLVEKVYETLLFD